MALEVDLGLRLDLRGVRQIVNHCIKNILYTFVFKRRTTEGREEFQVDRALPDAALQVLDRGLVALEVLLQQVVILLDGRLDQLLAPLLDRVPHVLGHVGDLVVLGIVPSAPDPRLALEQVDHAREVVLHADRQRHYQRGGCENVLDLLHDAVEVGADPVQLVDENDARNLGIVGVAPVRLRLRLHAARATENADTAVKNLERTVDFDREVHVSRRVDDVEAMLVPLAAGRGGLDRNAALLLLVHEVGRRFAVVDFARTMNFPRELQDALGRGRLARVDVGKYADVSVNA